MQEVPNKLHDKVPNKLREAFPLLPDVAWDIYGMLKDDGRQTSAHLAERIGISERMNGEEVYLAAQGPRTIGSYRK